MTSKFIWQIGEDWSITKVSKGNNKLFADAKATPVYAVLGNSQMLETDTVEMTCTINGQSYHKVLLHYAQTNNHIIVDDEAVAGWEVVSNGEELQTETSTFDVMTISFDIKRFSSVDGTTLLKNQPTGQTTENVYASDSYTPMVESSDAEHLEDLIAGLNAVKQDKYDSSLETENKTVVGGINELNNIKQDKHDENLETESKYVVGAINELQDRIEDIEDLDKIYVKQEDNSTHTVNEQLYNDEFSIKYNKDSIPSITTRLKSDLNNSNYYDMAETDVQNDRIINRITSKDGSGETAGLTTLTRTSFAFSSAGNEIFKATRNNFTFKGNQVETQNNKTNTIDSLSTNTQYPSTKSVYDFVSNEIQDVVEIAEGKTASYTISYETTGNEPFNSQNDSISLSSSGSIEDIEGNTIALADLKIGDIILITETEVPDRWVGSIASNVVTFYKMETSKIDLTDYVTQTQLEDELELKQDKLTAGNHIDITNNVIDTKDVVTLGTETQTFSGKTKILNLPTSSSTASYLRIQKDSTHYLTLSLNTFTDTDNLHIGVRNGSYESKLLGGGIRFQTYLLSFPSKNGTFALTSDIPTLDSTPTQNSTNGVTSGGVYQAIQSFVPSGINYLTTAPVADNTDGDLKIVVLSSEPATKYNGYLYFITEV